MSKVIRTTNRCPVCGYEYQVSKFFEDEEKTERKVVLKRTMEKKLEKMNEIEGMMLLSEVAMANTEFQRIGIISESAKSKCKIVRESYTEEVFNKEEVTKGEDAFLKVEYPLEEDTFFGGPSKPVDYFGMFCPKCGVFLNINTCTTVTEDKIE